MGSDIDQSGRKPSTELDETTVISRAQDGDLAAFEHLVDTYQGRIFRLAYRMLNNRPDSEDIVQETMIAAWRQLPLLQSPGAFNGWIYRVATNRCLDLLRRRRATHELPAGDEDLERQSQANGWLNHIDTSDPAAEAEITAQMHELAAILEAVSPEKRACWLLREMHGHSYTQIAEMLQISESSVRGRIARARNELAEGMNSWR